MLPERLAGASQEFLERALRPGACRASRAASGSSDRLRIASGATERDGNHEPKLDLGLRLHRHPAAGGRVACAVVFGWPASWVGLVRGRSAPSSSLDGRRSGIVRLAARGGRRDRCAGAGRHPPVELADARRQRTSDGRRPLQHGLNRVMPTARRILRVPFICRGHDPGFGHRLAGAFGALRAGRGPRRKRQAKLSWRHFVRRSIAFSVSSNACCARASGSRPAASSSPCLGSRRPAAFGPDVGRRAAGSAPIDWSGRSARAAWRRSGWPSAPTAPSIARWRSSCCSTTRRGRSASSFVAALRARARLPGVPAPPAYRRPARRRRDPERPALAGARVRARASRSRHGATSSGWRSKSASRSSARCWRRLHTRMRTWSFTAT